MKKRLLNQMNLRRAMMLYRGEWLSDLALIPAWECFLAGLLLGMLVTLAIIGATGGGRR